MVRAPPLCSAGGFESFGDRSGRERQAAGVHAADEEAVYNFCNELLNSKEVTDATFQAAVNRLGERRVEHLVGVVGYYHLVSMLLNIDRYPLPEGAKTELKPLPKAGQ